MFSQLLIFSADRSLVERVEAALAPSGWRCASVESADALLGLLPAAVLIDGTAPGAEDMATAIRELAPPLNGTPILTLGKGEEGGEGGQLEPPLREEALLDLLRQRAGPLDDHALRAEPWSPRYRLIRLLGLDGADAMLLRLRDALKEEQPSAHRLAGIAGLCGYTALSEAWSRVDRGEVGGLPAAEEASRETVREIERALGSA